jgi:hypothetical protein
MKNFKIGDELFSEIHKCRVTCDAGFSVDGAITCAWFDEEDNLHREPLKLSELEHWIGRATGAQLIQEERSRQIIVENFTREHDVQHDNGELAAAAASYALWFWSRTDAERLFPINWNISWLKASDTDRIRNLEKAAALIAAEIDRLLEIKRKEQAKKLEGVSV